MIDIDQLNKEEAKHYKVSCFGGCGSVSLEVNSKYGSPDLYAGYVQAFTLIYCSVTDIAFSLALQEAQDHFATSP